MGGGLACKPDLRRGVTLKPLHYEKGVVYGEGWSILRLFLSSDII